VQPDATPSLQSGLPRVAILLATYNGARFIDQQLESLKRQSGARFELIVSDDGSSDDTLDRVAAFGTQSGWPLTILKGPSKGFAENFRSLILNAPVGCDYYCFCDQDDVWMDDKTKRAIDALSAVSNAAGRLYCGRTQMIDEADATLGLSPLFAKPPTFRNALVQSIAGGNTMMMDSAAFDAVRRASDQGAFVSHDWLAYQVVSGCGGAVIYDPLPAVLYRQHGGNLVGSNTGASASAKRLVAALFGRFKQWNDTNLRLLESPELGFTTDALGVLKAFAAARTGALPARLSALHRSGVYRQTWRGTASLWIACLINQM
jgi:glycosyltransferase involved in cell wall biosynthesis